MVFVGNPVLAASGSDVALFLREFPAEALAKSHGRSVVGREAAAEHLRNYRDAIAWTHDQTVRFMNKGYVRDQIVEQMGQMPPHLRAQLRTLEEVR